MPDPQDKTEETKPIGETVPGGRYIQGENVVDAEGKILEGPDAKKGDAVEADADAAGKKGK